MCVYTFRSSCNFIATVKYRYTCACVYASVQGRLLRVIRISDQRGEFVQCVLCPWLCRKNLCTDICRENQIRCAFCVAF